MTILVNFRQTVGYRSDDGADAYVETGLNAYPYPSGLGYTVGWENVDGTFTYLNRQTTGDPRLGGVVRVPAWVTNQYRIDLPSTGTYEIAAAFGDNTDNNTSLVHVLFRDNTTQFGSTIGPVYTTAIYHLYDATGVEHTSASNWVSNNNRITRTFTSTIFRTERVASSDNLRIVHLGVYPVEGGTVLPIFFNHYRQQGIM